MQIDDDVDFVNPFGCDEEGRVPNIMMDIGVEASADVSVKKFTVPKMVSDEDYRLIIETLNEKQLDYAYFQCI